MANPPVRYKVFVKVPFDRGDFVDPPDPNWNSSKDKELWRILSSATKGKQIDWHGLADKFDVTLEFLLQQAAWLYERQLSQVREQLRRVNRPSPTNASPSPPPDSAAASSTATQTQGMKRAPSSGQHTVARQSPNLTLRTKRSTDRGRDSPAGSPVQERPQRAAYSRTPSANTITQLQKSAFSPVGTSGSGPRSPTVGNESVIRRPAAQPPTQHPNPASPSPKASPSASESSSSDDDAPPLGQSRAFQRRPRFSSIMAKGKSKPNANISHGLDAVNDDDEDSGSDSGFLPFAAAPASQPKTKPGTSARTPALTSTAAIADTSATRRTTSPPSHQRTDRPAYNVAARTRSDSANVASLSDSASPASPSASQSSSHGASASASHPSLPPNDHRSALAALSPRQRRSVARDGSDTGTPSMGSSFSDLDDASVSMSAMEEALAHQMRGAGQGQGQGAGTAAASALRGSLAMGMNMWKGRGTTQGRGQGR